ncbi:MAG: hypothetical protein JNM09_19380 [Blastocatellia bacterium]|nr:hypothetical protein [Blastocatellia bacterium]
MAKPLEEQISILQACGINLLPSVTIAQLLSLYDREVLEAEGFETLLVIIGGELDEEPYGSFSEDIWHFDTECIEDHGAYVEIAMRLRDLAKGDLPLENINDYVNIDENVAWLSFTLDGQEIKWDAVVDNDWVDPEIFSRFADLLAQRNTGRKFTYCDLGGGQDCLIGCSTQDQLERLRKETGMGFEWLQ